MSEQEPTQTAEDVDRTEMAREMLADGDPVLTLAAWLDYAAQADRNAEYYRGLVARIGEKIGEAAYTADDGSRADSVLCAKVPDLADTYTKAKVAEAVMAERNYWRGVVQRLVTCAERTDAETHVAEAMNIMMIGGGCLSERPALRTTEAEDGE